MAVRSYWKPVMLFKSPSINCDSGDALPLPVNIWKVMKRFEIGKNNHAQQIPFSLAYKNCNIIIGTVKNVDFVSAQGVQKTSVKLLKFVLRTVLNANFEKNLRIRKLKKSILNRFLNCNLHENL